MQNLKILNKKEIKKIVKLLEQRFDFSGDLDYVFLSNNKNKIFLTKKDFGNIPTEKLKINNIGMYFGEVLGSEIRLSIEGSHLIGKDCKKNILELNEQFTQLWLNGIDIEVEYENKGYVLLKNKNDFLGCGKAVQNKILNFVPKNRRVNIIECCD